MPTPKGEINVGPASVAQDFHIDPVKPGSSRDKLFTAMGKKVEPGTSFDIPPKTDAAPPQEKAKPPTPEAKPEAAKAEVETKPVEGDKPPEGEVTAPDAKGKKFNVKELYEQYKKKSGELEMEVAKLKTSSLAEQERSKYLDEIKKHQTRAEELENEIRYVNYSQHPEFKQEYEQPFNTAFNSAFNDLKSLPVTDPATGQQRLIQPQDLFDIYASDLPEAKKKARELVGDDFVTDVLQNRTKVRDLWDKKQNALAEAKKSGGEREKQRYEQFQRQHGEIAKQVSQIWQTENEAVLKHEKHGEFFRPIEGDQDGNQRLAKGFEIVDRAFAENPANPNLKPEERAAIVKRHVAVRHRAAAFGRNVQTIKNLRAELATANEKLSQFETSRPSINGNHGTSAPVGVVTGKDRLFDALGKRVERM